MTVERNPKSAFIESIEPTSKIIKQIKTITGCNFYSVPGYTETLVPQFRSWFTNKIEITSFFEQHLSMARISREILMECIEKYHPA